ncbi:TPA: DinQ-like type I toxin DqlB, partial [Escherichia coli]
VANALIAILELIRQFID